MCSGQCLMCCRHDDITGSLPGSSDECSSDKAKLFRASSPPVDCCHLHAPLHCTQPCHQWNHCYLRYLYVCILQLGSGEWQHIDHWYNRRDTEVAHPYSSTRWNCKVGNSHQQFIFSSFLSFTLYSILPSIWNVCVLCIVFVIWLISRCASSVLHLLFWSKSTEKIVQLLSVHVNPISISSYWSSSLLTLILSW